jgi:hypothetical protein
MAGPGNLWVDDSGVLYSPRLSAKLQFTAQPMFRFREYVDIKEAFGKQVGESVNWDKIANVTSFGGQVAETNTMPTTRQAITKGTLSVLEYGNAIPYTGKIEALSQQSLETIINKGLKDDMVKCLDGEVERQFNGTQLRYVGTTTVGGALTTNGTATATNTSAFNLFHAGTMADELRKRNVPGYESLEGRYVCICSIEALRGLKSDMQGKHPAIPTNFSNLVNGGQFEYDNIVFVLDTFGTRFTYSSSAKTATAKTWTGNASLDAYMFGADTVREAVAIPEQIRQKEVTDYGRSKGLAWYFLGGWQLEWSDEPNTRIIKWTCVTGGN